MEIHPEEKPVSLQLFGSDPDIISEMAKRSRKSRLIFLTSIWAVRCQRWSITEKALP